MIYIKNRLGTKKRDKAFLGALVGAVTSIGSALISSNSAKKQRRQQERADEYNRMVQEAANDTAAYNSAMNYQDDYNKMFQTQVRLGTKKNKLRNSRIVITDGGDAQQVSNDTFLLRGGSHEDVNETGQTGIGINVGGNQIEAEGGEVAQTRNGSLRIFSAQPILGNGMSPAQAVLRGYNKDKVFTAQQRFKKNNNLNDDGSKVHKLCLGGRARYRWGTADYIDAAKTIGSYLPIIGTIEDGYNFYKNPTLENAGWLAFGVASDFVGGRGIIKGAKALRNINKMSVVANTIPRLSTRLAVQKQLNNGRKAAIHNIQHGCIAADDQIIQNTVDRVRNKQYNDSPRSKKTEGSGWVKPVYPTVGYHGSKRVRQYIAKAEGSDFAKQNKQFKGDAIGTKELELRNFMGKAYQHLNEGQRDALLSYYYNLKPSTFVNQYKGLRDKLINAQTEQEYNDTINAMKNSINVGWNNKKLPGLRNRRAVERSWFGYVNPTAQQMVNDKINQIETVPVDNTMVQKPIVVDIPQQEVHVPAGVIPVQNTEPNLLNGNIKQNIINMGNQFKAKYSCGGTARKRSIASRPVKGMYRCGGTARPKKALGTNWSDIQNDLNGSGGVIPWQPNNNFNVQVPYAITSSTPTIQYKATYSPSIDSGISTKVGSLKSGVAKTSEPSGLKLDTGSYISLGADLLGALGSTFINSKSANKTYIPKAPIRLQPSKLKTIYNVNPQIASIERQRGNMRDEIMRNTSSSAAALQRLTDINNATVDSENQLYQLKENQETQMLNQDSLNQQQVAEKNVEAQNQYNYYVANLRNQQQQAKANALSTGLIGVTNAINNFVGQGRQNYDDEQAMLMGIAASDYATPSRLIDLGVNLSPSSLAGIYRSVNNTPNPGNAPKPEDYSSTTEYSIAKNAYDRSLKAYNNRNAYANLVKSRMSLRQRRRYGIN